jgi:hypothetical protein
MLKIFAILGGITTVICWAMCRQGSYEDTSASSAWHRHFKDKLK